MVHGARHAESGPCGPAEARQGGRVALPVVSLNWRAGQPLWKHADAKIQMKSLNKTQETRGNASVSEHSSSGNNSLPHLTHFYFYFFFFLSCSTQFVVNFTQAIRPLISKVIWLLSSSARPVLGQSSCRLPQLQLHAHPAAGVQKPPLLPARLHPGIHENRLIKQRLLISSKGSIKFILFLKPWGGLKWSAGRMFAVVWVKSVLVLCLQYCSRTAARQLDRNLTFHKLVAYMIAFHTGIICAEDDSESDENRFYQHDVRGQMGIKGGTTLKLCFIALIEFYSFS